MVDGERMIQESKRPGFREVITFSVDEGGIHNEKAWAGRFPAAFLWLFEGAAQRDSVNDGLMW